MDQERTKAGTEGDESLLDQAEDALVGDHPEGTEVALADREDRKQAKDKPVLKSP